MNAGKEFDDKMAEHLKVINSGGIQHLESLLSEIATFQYDTVSQVLGAINKRVDILKEKVGE